MSSCHTHALLMVLPCNTNVDAPYSRGSFRSHWHRATDIMHVCMYVCGGVTTRGSSCFSRSNFSHARRVYPMAAKADGRAAKLMRFDRFRRAVPHLSASALSSVLRRVDDEGVPELFSRNVALEAQDHIMARRTPCGPLLESREIHGCKVQLVNPAAMLWTAVKENGAYAAMLQAALHERPPSLDRPWRFAVYSDEVTPGNVMAPDNLRKVWILYWALLDLSMQSLHSENAWFLLTAKRSSEVAKVPGGISAVMASCLEAFFTDGACDVSTVGVLLEFADGSKVRLFLVMNQMIQDDGAHKLVWGCVGAAGTKFCMLCLNALSHSSGEVDEDNNELLAVDILRRRDLHLASCAQIYEALDRLDAYVAADPTMSDAKLKTHEQHLGFKRNPYGLLHRARLRRHIHPSLQFVHDWMHVMCVQGVINITLYLALKVLNAEGVTWAMVYGFTSLWYLPFGAGGGARNPAEVLKPKRIETYKKAKRIKCQASEIVSLLPLVAIYLATLVLPNAGADTDVAKACRVVITLNAVVELLMTAPRGVVEPSQLLAAVEEFLELYRQAFGTATMVSKFHSMLHFADELDRFKTMLTCWVHERKHRMVRSWCSDIKNTVQFEKGIISNTVCQHLYELAKPDNFVLRLGLLEPWHDAPRALADCVRADIGAAADARVTTARRARFSEWGICATSDCVLVSHARDGSLQAGWVWKHAHVQERAVSLLQLGDNLTKDLVNGVATWRLRDAPEWVATEDIIEAVAFSWDDAVTVRTLMPCQCRDF